MDRRGGLSPGSSPVSVRYDHNGSFQFHNKLLRIDRIIGRGHVDEPTPKVEGLSLLMYIVN